MNIAGLREDPNNPNHWTASVDGLQITVVTRVGQDPLEVIAEVMGAHEATYADKRVQEYPSIQEQLDMIYHDIDSWRGVISAIKEKHPKAE